MNQTLDYQWVRGSHRLFMPSHHQPRTTQWLTGPWVTIVCPHESSYTISFPNGKTEITIKPNEVAVVPGKTPLRVYQHTPGHHTYAHIIFSTLMTMDPLSFYDVPYTFCGSKLEEIRQALLDVSSTHIESAKSLEQVVRQKESAFRILRLLMETGEHTKDRDKLLEGYSRIHGAIKYIEEHVSEKISREELASISNLSPSYFSQVFRHTVGISPKQYILRSRLQQAINLLMETEMSISQIALSCGFCDQFEFSRQFKNMWGESPLNYRKIIREYHGSSTFLHLKP